MKRLISQLILASIFIVSLTLLVLPGEIVQAAAFTPSQLTRPNSNIPGVTNYGMSAVKQALAPLITIHGDNCWSKGPDGQLQDMAWIIIDYNSGSDEWDICSPGYHTPSLGHVTYLETANGNANDHIWFKWYNGYTGRYCYGTADGLHWTPPPGITNITQVDYGNPLPNPLPSGTYRSC